MGLKPAPWRLRHSGQRNGLTRSGCRRERGLSRRRGVGEGRWVRIDRGRLYHAGMEPLILLTAGIYIGLKLYADWPWMLQRFDRWIGR